MNILTYSQKEIYLIDVQGYTEDELLDLGEIGLDNIIIGSNWMEECIEFNQ